MVAIIHRQSSKNSLPSSKYFGQMKEEDNLRGIRIARMIEFKRINDVKRKYQKYCMTINQVTEELTKIQLVISTFGIALHLATDAKLFLKMATLYQGGKAPCLLLL